MTERDPRQEPRRGDITQDRLGRVRTILGRTALGSVRYSQANPPYLASVPIELWRNMARNYRVVARAKPTPPA